MRFGQSGKAWSFTAPAKLGQALSTCVAVTPVTPLSVATSSKRAGARRRAEHDRSEALIRSSLGLARRHALTESRPNVNVDVVSPNWRPAVGVRRWGWSGDQTA